MPWLYIIVDMDNDSLRSDNLFYFFKLILNSGEISQLMHCNVNSVDKMFVTVTSGQFKWEIIVKQG